MFKFLCKPRVKGSISILVSIIFIPIFSLTTLLVEVGRYRCAKQVLAESLENAEMSMLAGYDKDLQERFGLLALDKEKISKEKLLDYVYYNSNLEDEYNTTNMDTLYSVLNVDYEAMYNLANKDILKRQILEYAKYRVPISTLSEFLEIEGALNTLKEKFQKWAGTYEKICKTINLVSSLADAFKKMYELENTIAQLNMAVKGAGWRENAASALAGFLGNPKLEECNPCYNTAYDNVIKAINAKTKYMKENENAAKDPGPEPSKGEQEYSEYKTQYNELYKQIQIKFEKVKEEDVKEGDVLGNYSFAELQKKWEELKDKQREKLSELYTKVEGAYSIYSAVAEKHGSWSKKNQEYQTYKEKIAAYDGDINKKVTQYKTIAKKVKKYLKQYRTSLSEVNGSIEEAQEAVAESKDNEKFNGEFDKVSSDFIDNVIKPTNGEEEKDGITFIDNMLKELEKFSPADIKKNTKADSISGYHYLFKEKNMKKCYMSYEEVIVYINAFNAIKIVEKGSDLFKMLELLDVLGDVFSIIPDASDDDFDTNLSNSIYKSLPSVSKAGEKQKNYPEDMSSLSKILKDAEKKVSNAYGFDIDSISPEAKLKNAETEINISDRIEETIEIIVKLQKVQAKVMGGGAIGLIELVLNLDEIIGDVKTLFENIGYFIKNFELTIEVLLNNIYNSLLLNGYAVSKFPNRVEELSDASVDSLGSRNTSDTFKQAQVEYIISGNRDELKNQSDVYWKIFVVRIVVNIVAVLTDETAQQLISGTSLVGLLVIFPIWVYLETVWDMNFMITLGLELPLIKTTLIISAENIAQTLENILALNGVKLKVKFKIKKSTFKKCIPKKNQSNKDDSNKTPDKDDSDKNDSKVSLEKDDSKVSLEKDDSKVSLEKDTISDDEGTYTYETVSQTEYQVTARIRGRIGKSKLQNMAIKAALAKILQPGDGIFKMDYKDYLVFLLCMTGEDNKVLRMGDLIQMEQSYTKGKKYRMKNANTYIRAKVTAKYNDVFPVEPLGDSDFSFDLLRLSALKYAGY